MTPKQARLLHISSALVGGTGVALFVLRDLVEVQNDFGPQNHPLDADMMVAHILTAPALIFACGLIWQDHVWLKYKAGYSPRRRTGLLLGSLLFPMILSGYLFQAAHEEFWRELWRVTHLASSLVWLLGYGVHQLTRRTG